MGHRTHNLKPGDYLFAPPRVDLYDDKGPRDLWRVTANTRLNQYGTMRLEAVSETREGVALDVTISGYIGISYVEPEDVEKLKDWARQERALHEG